MASTMASRKLLGAFNECQDGIGPNREAVKLLVLVLVERGWRFQRFATPRPGQGSTALAAIRTMVIEAIAPFQNFRLTPRGHDPAQSKVAIHSLKVS
jgi:hypothetical protein